MQSIAEIVQGVLEANRQQEEPVHKMPPQPVEKPVPFITIPVSIGLLEKKHVEAMGIALWCFLWCVNRVTTDRTDANGERWGQVLGGCRFNHQRIADELGLPLRSVRYQMDRLKTAGYLRITRCRDGQQVEVRHSIKWLRRKTQPQQKKGPAKPPPVVPKPPAQQHPARPVPIPVNPAVPVPSSGNEPAQVFSLTEALRKKQWEREQAAEKTKEVLSCKQK